MKKNKKRRFIIIGVLLAAILLVGSLLVRSVFSSKKKSGGNLIQSYEVTTGNVDSTVSATGNISMDDTTDIVASTGVIVKEILVESGDEVKKGDVLAKLDKTSVVSELIEAKDTKEDLEDQLDDDDLTSLEEEKIEGEIEEVNERITALNKLHDNPVIKATVSGVITSINISEGSEITNTVSSSGSSSGSTDTSSQLSIPTSDNGSSSEATAAASGGSSSATAATAAVSGGSPSMMATARAASSGNTSAEVSNLSDAQSAAAPSVYKGSAGLELIALNSSSDSDSSEQSEDDNTGSTDEPGEKTTQTEEAITDLSALQITAPVTGQKAQSSVQSTGAYTGKISWSPSDSTFKAGTAYTATVILTAKDGYIFQGNYEGGTISDGGKQLTIVRSFEKTAEVSDSGGNQENDNQTTQNNNQTTQSPDKTTQNPDKTTQNPNQTTQSQGGAGNVSIPGASGSSGMGSYGSGSISTGSASSSSGSASTEFYGTYKAAAFTINTMKNVRIVVSIDELDILSIEKGQTAKVTLDALEDEEFEGTISKISTTATTSNGNTKYDVEITIPQNDDIMDGMSASVVIVTDSAENAVMIPALALLERGEKQFVYTSQDDDGNLSGEVEVETGLSDGTNVEITSGLSEGDTIYYQMASGDDLEQIMNQNMQRNRDANMDSISGGGGNGGPGGDAGPGGNGGGPGGNGGGGQ